MAFNQRGSVAVIVAVVMTLFSFLFLVFGIWAFSGRQTYKNDVDAIVAEKSAAAVKEAEGKKDAEFAEQEKNPYQTYNGPDTYGSVTFQYPRTWSIMRELDAKSIPVAVYGNPDIIPGIGNDSLLALRHEVLNRPYEQVLGTYESAIERGSVTASAFRPELVPTELGTRLDGELEKGVRGAAVLLPLRDKTIVLRTQSETYVGDFNALLKTLSFSP